MLNQYSIYKGVNFRVLDIPKQFVENVKFIHCTFDAVDFNNSTFKNCVFDHCKVYASSLDGCNFINCIFDSCHFESLFFMANCNMCIFAHITGEHDIVFCETDFKDCVIINYTVFNRAIKRLYLQSYPQDDYESIKFYLSPFLTACDLKDQIDFARYATSFGVLSSQFDDIDDEQVRNSTKELKELFKQITELVEFYDNPGMVL